MWFACAKRAAWKMPFGSPDPLSSTQRRRNYEAQNHERCSPYHGLQTVLVMEFDPQILDQRAVRFAERGVAVV